MTQQSAKPLVNRQQHSYISGRRFCSPPKKAGPLADLPKFLFVFQEVDFFRKNQPPEKQNFNEARCAFEQWDMSAYAAL